MGMHEIEIAKVFIRSLSFRDYITIITYADVPIPYSDLSLVRADSSHVDALLEYLSNISVSTGGYTNVGLAVRMAYKILNNFDTATQSSTCLNTLVILSGGRNDIEGIDPLHDALENPLPVVIFSFLII